MQGRVFASAVLMCLFVAGCGNQTTTSSQNTDDWAYLNTINKVSATINQEQTKILDYFNQVASIQNTPAKMSDKLDAVSSSLQDIESQVNNTVPNEQTLQDNKLSIVSDLTKITSDISNLQLALSSLDANGIRSSGDDMNNAFADLNQQIIADMNKMPQFNIQPSTN